MTIDNNLNSRRITELGQHIADSLLEGDVCGCSGHVEYLNRLRPDHPALPAYRAHLAIRNGELSRAVSFIFNIPLERDYNLAWVATTAAQEAYIRGAISFNEMHKFIGLLMETRSDVYYDYGEFLCGKVLKKIDGMKEFDPNDSDLIFMHFFSPDEFMYTVKTVWEDKTIFDRYLRKHLGEDSELLPELPSAELPERPKPKRLLKSVMTCESDGDAA